MSGSTIDFQALEQQPQAAPPPAGGEGKPIDFAALEGNAAPTPSGKTSGMLANVGASFNDLIAGAAGFPVDFVNAGLNLVGLGTKRPIGGSESIKQAMGLIGANPENVVPTTEPQRIARTLSGGIASTVVPGVGAEAALARAGDLLLPKAVALLKAISGGEPAASGAALLSKMAANAGIGAASGAGQYIGEQVTPEPYKPAGAVLGSLAGGMGGALLEGGGRAFLRALHGGEPVQTEAANRFLAGAANPEAVRQNLNSLEPESPVPGVQPTTPEMTNDTGLLQMQNWARNQRPEAFAQRAYGNNAARVQQLEGLVTKGSPEQAAQFFRGQLDNLDRAYQTALTSGQTAVERALGDMGGNPDLTADVDTLRQQYGQQFRQYVQDAAAARKAAVDQLWDRIRQNGDIAFDSEPAAQAAQAAQKAVNPQAGDQMVPREQTLLDVIGGWNGPVDFDTLSAARSNVSSLINQLAREGGSARSVSRLMQVREGLDASIDQAIGRRITAEDAAVAAGTLRPEQTVRQSVEDWERNFLASRDQWLAENRPGQRPGAALAGSGARPAAPQPPTAPNVPGAYGTAGEALQGRSAEPANSASNPGVAPPEGEVADQYAAARQAYREYKQTYDEGPAGKLLERGNYGREWELPDSQAAALFWNGGKHQAEDVRAFEEAVGGHPEALDALKDYAASELRRYATGPDGKINLSRWRTWLRQHQDALSVYPDLKARFEAPAAAQEVVDEATAQAAETHRQYEKSAARFWLKNEPDQAIAKAMGDKGRAADNIREMMRMTASHPDAQAGIRRGVLEWLMRKAAPQGIAGKEAGDTGTSLIRGQTFRNMVNDYRQALGQVFDRNQMKTLDAIADDLVMADRSVSGSKPPIGPGTARDIAAMGRFGGKAPTLLRVLASGVGRAGIFALGEHMAGLPGAIGGILGSDAARELTRSMRAARTEKIEDLIIGAILDPQEARALLANASPASAHRLAQRMMQVAIGTENRKREQ